MRLALLFESVHDVVARVNESFDTIDNARFGSSVHLGAGCSGDARVPTVGRQRVDELLKALFLRLRLKKPLHLWIFHSAECSTCLLGVSPPKSPQIQRLSDYYVLYAMLRIVFIRELHRIFICG